MAAYWQSCRHMQALACTRGNPLALRLTSRSRHPLPRLLDRSPCVRRRQVRPLEEQYCFDAFYSSPLQPGDFDAKPSVLLLGQYSTGGWLRWLVGCVALGRGTLSEPTSCRGQGAGLRRCRGWRPDRVAPCLSGTLCFCFTNKTRQDHFHQVHPGPRLPRQPHRAGAHHRPVRVSRTFYERREPAPHWAATLLSQLLRAA